MTGPEHYREAEHLAASADDWLDADTGWKGQLPSEERLARRAADLAAAQVHATLAHAAATALNLPHPEAGLNLADAEEWETACARQRPGKDGNRD